MSRVSKTGFFTENRFSGVFAQLKTGFSVSVLELYYNNVLIVNLQRRLWNQCVINSLLSVAIVITANMH